MVLGGSEVDSGREPHRRPRKGEGPHRLGGLRAPGSTYIYLGHAYPDPRRLTIMIPGRDRKRFPYNPEGMFLEGKLVCAQGVVKRVQGLPQITVHRWDKPRRMLR